MSGAPQVFSTNSDSTSNGKVVAASGARVQAGGFNLPVSQGVSLNSDLKHETLIIPSSSAPGFGSFFTIDIKEKNILLNNVTLQFMTSARIGTALVGYFNPAFFWFTRIELVQGGTVIDNIYGNQQHIMQQILEWDEDRLAINNAAGNYASSAQRTTLSSQTTQNVVYANLRTYFDQAKVALLSDAHNIQLRVYMDTLPNVYNVVSGSLQSCTLLSCNAICKVTRLDLNSVAVRVEDMRLRNNHAIMHSLSYANLNVAIGNSSTTLVLSSIVGNVAALFFTIRPSAIGAAAWNYSQLASFSLLDAAGTNLVGGQPLPSAFALQLLNKDWMKSSYNTETSYGTNNQGANVYMWSFSCDPVAALSNGQALSSRKMTGNEQLVLNFPSALTSAVQVEVYAFVESVLEQTLTSVRKISL